MNEQLVVKNFGPIKDATVDFKRVTVFIGPTGGGKSTLAKLAAVFSAGSPLKEGADLVQLLSNYGIENYRKADYKIELLSANSRKITVLQDIINCDNDTVSLLDEGWKNYSANLNRPLLPSNFQSFTDGLSEEETALALEALSKAWEAVLKQHYFKGLMQLKFWVHYVPAERLLVSTLNTSWPALISAKVNFPKTLLDFATEYLKAGTEIAELSIPFLNISYSHFDDKGFINSIVDKKIAITEVASGIQSVVPMLVILEKFSRDKEHGQSFIIEEPELNLFPLAQFELVKTLVDKCARLDGRNDLVLTTHSPYVLTALNLLCYAFRIAQQDEATAKKVAQLIPRHCWIDPEQFAAYYVDRPDTKRKQQVRSIINKKTGLIEENELDTASDELSAIFDKLLRLRKPTKTTVRTK